jgi:ribose-phosphate pyrophosphokinase
MVEAEIKVISGRSNTELAQEIADAMGIKLGGVECKRFSDGEISVKISENVRGTDVFVIQSTSNPANDNLMELMLIVDALRRASARRITAVIPYYGYARQDRKVEPRVPISAKVVATMLEAIGVKRVLSMDLHANQIQGFFEIPVDHLFGAPILIKYFRELSMNDLVIVSPDVGGAERARFFGKQLGASMAIIDKRRERANEAEVMHIVGNVEGKNCILIDDMIDTAGTICKAAIALKEKGAQKIIAAATHGVLSGSAIQNLIGSPIDEVVVTNTLKISDEKRFPRMRVLSVGSIFATAIQHIHEEKSVSSLFL